jgi:hypothetical protein
MFETIDSAQLALATGGADDGASPQPAQTSPYDYANGPRMLPVYGAPNATAIYCDLGHNPSKCSTIAPGGLVPSAEASSNYRYEGP